MRAAASQLSCCLLQIIKCTGGGAWRAGKHSLRDYYLPASADKAVQELYTFLQRHAPGGPDYYSDALHENEEHGYWPRERVLDRYGQHTQHCAACQVRPALAAVIAEPCVLVPRVERLFCGSTFVVVTGDVSMPAERPSMRSSTMCGVAHKRCGAGSSAQRTAGHARLDGNRHAKRGHSAGTGARRAPAACSAGGRPGRAVCSKRWWLAPAARS